MGGWLFLKAAGALAALMLLCVAVRGFLFLIWHLYIVPIRNHAFQVGRKAERNKIAEAFPCSEGEMHAAFCALRDHFGITTMGLSKFGAQVDSEGNLSFVGDGPTSNSVALFKLLNAKYGGGQ